MAFELHVVSPQDAGMLLFFMMSVFYSRSAPGNDEK
jgi:hypothetical protein